VRLIVLAAAAIVSMAADALPGSWTTGPPMPEARSEVAVAAAGDTMYVVGGYADGNVDQALVEAIHPVIENGRVTGVWRNVAPLPHGLNHPAAVGYHGKVFTFGGFSAQNNAAVAEANVYDPSTNAWSPLPSLPHPLGSVSAAVLGDEIHLVGGRDAHSVGTHVAYDPGVKRYSVRAPLPVGRDHMGLVAYNGRLYAIGGRIDTPAHNSSRVDIYDPAKDSWTSGAAMPTPRSGMAVVLYEGAIFAMGGEASGMKSSFTTNARYDPSSNTWSDFAPLPEGRHGTGAATMGRRIYVPGGAAVPGGSQQSNSLLVFKV
jgi:N-acetylneuraminic acid mutarotase